MVVFLWFAYLFHQADKQIYSVVLIPLRQELGLTAYQGGLVNTIFTVVVAVMSPLAGALGDRWPKHRVLWMIVAVWSLATAATAFSPNLAVLLLTRSIVTAGAESFYPPVSHALLAGWHTSTRALAISIHQTAQYSGPIASGFLSGWIAENWGWRNSFLLFGAAGLVLAPLMAWRLRDPETGGLAATQREPLFAGFVYCFQSAPVRLIGFAFASVLFVSVGYSTWAPTIFVTQFHLSLAEAGFQTTFWTSVPAMAGALAGGALSDWFAAAGRSRFELQAVALLLAAPFLWVLGGAQSLPVAIGGLSAVGFCRGIYEGTLAVSLYDHVSAHHRSSAAAVVLLLANLLAAPSAALLGWAADRADLNRAVSLLSVCFVIAGLVLATGRRFPATHRAS